MQFLKKIVLLHIVIFVLRNSFYILEKITPKKQEHLLFFLTEKYYFDNSRYLFEYMRKHTNRESRLFTRNKKLYLQLNKKFPNEVIYAYTLKGFLYFLRTKQVVISYGISAAAFTPYYLHEKGKQIIYLGHGTPMKKMGLQTRVWQKYGKAKQLQPYSYMVGSSPLEQLIHAAGFNIDMNNVWVTGLPRNDYLLQESNLNSDYLAKYSFLKKKIILYAPTWREEGHKTHFFPFQDFNATQLSDFLEQEDAYILVRGHKEDIKRKTVEKTHNFFAIDRVIKADQNLFEDVYQLLPFVDILITDYSSLWIDYLLLDRPIVFLPYDLQEYSKYKGFFIDFKNNTPGFKSNTQFEFIKHLRKYIHQPEIHTKWRRKIRNLYHHNQDANSCERVSNKIQKLNQ